MARKFNPFDREAAYIQLGETEFEVREATRGVMRRVSEVQKRIEGIDEEDTDAAVRLFAEMIAASVVNGDHAADEILHLWNTDRLSLSALVRTVQFIGEELQGDTAAGE